MIRRLIRWLARSEIMEAYEAGSAMAKALMLPEVKMREELAFAKGQRDGAQAAFDAVEVQFFGRRTCDVKPEELEAVRKGYLH